MGWDSNNHILLTAPISIGDLTYATGISDLDVGSQLTSGSWNLWAKYKACNDTTHVGVLTDAQRKAANWGVKNIPIWSRLGYMVNFWYDISTQAPNVPSCGLQAEYWTLDRPSRWYRILDFDGYEATAQAPISAPSAFISLTGGVTLYCDLGAMGSGTLAYEDFSLGITGNTYFGYVLRKHEASPEVIYYITKPQDEPITSYFNTNITIPASSSTPLFNNTWEVFPYLTNQYAATLSTNQNVDGVFVALLDPILITIDQTKANYTLVFDPGRRPADNPSYYTNQDQGRNVNYVFSVTNNETDTNLTNVVVTITLYGADEQTVVATQTASPSTQGAVIAAGTTWDYSSYYRASSSTIAAGIKWVKVAVTSMTQSFESQAIRLPVIVDPLPI